MSWETLYYAGVLKYGNSYADLESFYDFTPVVTIEEFFNINKIKDFTSVKLVSSVIGDNKRENTKANLLRGVVYCGYCNQTFSSGLTYKKLKAGKAAYYYYKCETDGCKFKGKSIRAKVILDYAYTFLDTYMFTTKSNYAHFVEDARAYTSSERKSLTSAIMSLTKLIGNKQNEYNESKLLIRNNPELKEHYNLKETKKELTDLQERLGELNNKRDSLKQSILTYKEYLELFESISVDLRKTSDMTVIDQTLRKFFSNFIIKAPLEDKKQGSEITHKLKEPWNGFIKTGDVHCGRG